MLNINSYRFLLVTLLILMGISFANASVVMSGSRIIYSAGEKEHSVQLTNKDNFPNAVQVWLDSGDAQSTPETGKAPFIVTPPFFRIEANAGQTLRLKYTGSGLPTDRESVFYHKVFYRPKNLPAPADTVSKALTFALERNGNTASVRVDNPTPYYASLASLTLGLAEGLPDMVAPFSKLDFPLNRAPTADSKTVNFVLIDDLGNRKPFSRELK
ncbi:putative pilus chaperone%2C PapD family [Yersinia intermedia]|nr:putative pilus chaperone%2C PapD family [Yersinia intermedia]